MEYRPLPSASTQSADARETKKEKEFEENMSRGSKMFTDDISERLDEARRLFKRDLAEAGCGNVMNAIIAAEIHIRGYGPLPPGLLRELKPYAEACNLSSRLPRS
jgi:hypothetical protein